MTKRQRDFPDASSNRFADVPLLSIVLIMVIGTAVWTIVPKQFEYWFPAAVFISGLLIVFGEFLIKWLGKARE
jgi:hypothetical protein